MLKKVVLPAPFGPIRPTIDARRHGEVDVVDRDEAAELLPHPGRLQQRVGHHSAPAAWSAPVTAS